MHHLMWRSCTVLFRSTRINDEHLCEKGHLALRHQPAISRVRHLLRCTAWSVPQLYSPEVRDFMMKVFVKSGISPYGTYLPPAVHPCHTKEPQNDINAAMKEAETVM